MNKIELDAKPLSWWLTNAIERVENNAFPRTIPEIKGIIKTWKDRVLKQEQEIETLKGYVRHRAGCKASNWNDEFHDCTCGLDDALSGNYDS